MTGLYRLTDTQRSTRDQLVAYIDAGDVEHQGSRLRALAALDALMEEEP